MLRGRVWKFGDNINTDLMVPGSVLRRDAAEQMKHVFAANRPGWAAQVQPGDVLVAGCNFGMGSSRPAARALRNLRLRYVLAEQINGLFFRTCVNEGLLALECPGVAQAFEEGDTAELVLEAWAVTNPRTGAQLKPLPVPARLLTMMQEGGVIPLLEAEGLIAPLAKNT